MKTGAPAAENLWQRTQYSNLLRYKPSGVFFARIRINGKLIRRSLKTQRPFCCETSAEWTGKTRAATSGKADHRDKRRKDHRWTCGKDLRRAPAMFPQNQAPL